MQFAARQRRLEQVRGVHRAVGLARADNGVHFVDEEDVGAGRRRHFLQDGLEAFLELAAIFRPRNERAHVERQELLVFQTLGDVAIDDAQRQALDDRGLADARLADQHWIVLGPARQHLNRSADFLVAPDHRIELAVARRLGEVAGVFLQCLVRVFGGCRVGGAALAQRLDGGIEILRRDAGIGEDLSRLAPLLQRQRQKQPLNGDKTVAGLLAGFLGGLEDARQRRIEIDLSGATAGNLGALAERRLYGGQSLTRVAAGAVNKTCSEPLRIVKQHLEQVFGRELLMSLALRERLGGLDETAAAIGILFEIHIPSLGLFRKPLQRGRNIVMGL